MPRYLALLRAINVGGRNVTMERLRECFQEMGFANVETFIASGNVLFDTKESDEAALEQRIEAHLKQALGYEVATFLRSAVEMADAAERNPFNHEGQIPEGGALSVFFVRKFEAAEAQQRVLAYRNGIDDFAFFGREIYWSCRVKVSDSKFSGAVLEKALKGPATARNITTVRKLAAKMVR